MFALRQQVQSPLNLLKAARTSAAPSAPATAARRRFRFSQRPETGVYFRACVFYACGVSERGKISPAAAPRRVLYSTCVACSCLRSALPTPKFCPPTRREVRQIELNREHVCGGDADARGPRRRAGPEACGWVRGAWVAMIGRRSSAITLRLLASSTSCEL